MSDRYICFYLGEDLFIVPLHSVSEIYQLNPDKNYSELSKNVYMGHEEIGGEHLPLINLSQVVNRGFTRPLNNSESCILKFQLSDGAWGGVVDSLEGIIRINKEDIHQHKEPGSPIRAKAMGIRRSYLLMDPEKILNKIDRLRWKKNENPLSKAS